MIKILNRNAKQGDLNTDTYTHRDEILVRDITFVGCVISLREMNGYDDSDFYARVWDHAENCSREIQYATTRGWTDANHAEIDATPEVLALYEAEQARHREERKAANDAEIAKMPKVGGLVRVIKGRKVAKGTECEVFWIGKDTFKAARREKYRSGWEYLLGFHYDPYDYRVGVRLKDGSKVFVSAENIELV